MEEDFKPIIGKNVIESLTLGMYDDSRFIYREYVQNAADQIDIAVEDGILDKKADGKIHITILKDAKYISIEDNATGIQSNKVLEFLGNVAKSEKDGSKRKGFRGIGRLGGLGYCEKLIFETSYKGESIKSIMTLNANHLRTIITNKKMDLDASTVISVITTIERKPEELDYHYFKVILVGVTNYDIMDCEKVKNYLCMVAPIPFNDGFKFKDKIKAEFRKYNFILDEYNVDLKLNGGQLYKSYANSIYIKEQLAVVLDVDFFKIEDYENEIIAIGWYGYTNMSNVTLSTSCVERGIRLRKNNIGIGNENTLQRYFNEERTNLRFIGEIHVINEGFVPNARRDYFIENKTCLYFEKKLKLVLEKIDLEKFVARTASSLSNRFKEIEDYNLEKKAFEKRKETIESKIEEDTIIANLKLKEERAISAQKELNKINNLARTDNRVQKLYEYIVGANDINVKPNLIRVDSGKSYPIPTFAKLNENETNVVLEIYRIIDDTLDIENAKNLKVKISKRFN